MENLWILYGYSMDLVGGIPTPLKNMSVNWDDEINNIWKIEKTNHHPE